jgi:hypothetical protein
LGADKHVLSFDEREIRLTKWDRRAFAQGVVMFAFEDLMPVEQRLMLAKRAVIWADSTVDIRTTCKIAGSLATWLWSAAAAKRRDRSKIALCPVLARSPLEWHMDDNVGTNRDSMIFYPFLVFLLDNRIAG